LDCHSVEQLILAMSEAAYSRMPMHGSFTANSIEELAREFRESGVSKFA
jgi:hypothetical protein